MLSILYNIDLNYRCGVRNETSNLQDIQNNNNVVMTQNNVSGDIVTYNVPVDFFNHYPRPVKYQPADDSCLEFQVADPVKTFRGRQDELNGVLNAFHLFQEKDEYLEYNLVVVCGYGGIGKTEFARTFIKNFKTKFNNIVWINAEFGSSIQDSFDKLQKKLGKCYEQQDVYNYLNSDKCLFIFDNSQNWTQIEPFLPQKTNNSLFLVTSQCKKWEPYQIIQLNKLNEHDAENVVKSILNIHNININNKELSKLISKVETIPLVLQITAGHITQQVIRSRKLKMDYNMIHLIQKLNIESQLLMKRNPSTTVDRYKKSIFHALLPTLNKIHSQQCDESSLTMTIVSVAAYLNADHIGTDILRKLIKYENEESFEISLVNLIEFSLFQLFEKKIEIHRTVQDCIRYYHQETVTDVYYTLSLSVLLADDCLYKKHHMIVTDHSKNYLQSFISFYNDHMSSTLNTNFAKYVSYEIITQLINGNVYRLIQNAEFLYSLAKCERDDILQVLETHNIDFNVLDVDGMCALHYACLRYEEGHLITDIIFNFTSTLILKLSIIKYLVAYGSDVNMLTCNRDTVLHLLCNSVPRRDDWIFVACATLIKFGADLTIKNNQEETAAHLAGKHGLYKTFALLETANPKTQYMLAIIAKYKLFNILLSLIEANFCSINDEDESGNTILHILAELNSQSTDDEIEILYTTLELVQVYNANVQIRNIRGETAAIVAQRSGLQKLAKALQWLGLPPGHILNTSVHRNRLKSFRFVRSHDKNYVDDINDAGNTILLAVCDLENDEVTNNEDVTKLAIHLVVWYEARVNVTNLAGNTAADIARYRGRLLLADFLHRIPTITSSCRATELVYVALKHRNFDLLKYAWWRYLYDTDEEITYGWPGQRGCEVLHALCDVQNESVPDDELTLLAECIDLKQIAQYERTKDVYMETVKTANRHGRKEFVKWLQDTNN